MAYAFALDLDGTTLGAEGKLTEYTRRVLDRAMEASCEVIVASGRALESLPAEIREYPGIRYAITSNGAAVCDMKANREMIRYTLDPQAVDQILALTTEAVVFEIFIRGVGYAERDYVEDPGAYGIRSPQGIRYIQTTRNPVTGMREFMAEHRQEIDCIDIIPVDMGEVPKIRLRLRDAVPGIMITASIPRMLEIADIHAGKGNALRFLLEQLEIPMENAAAFGNAENDIDMMRAAGIGVAVANAEPACLAAADIVTTSNYEDGVAKVIEMLLEQWK